MKSIGLIALGLAGLAAGGAMTAYLLVDTIGTEPLSHASSDEVLALPEHGFEVDDRHQQQNRPSTRSLARGDRIADSAKPPATLTLGAPSSPVRTQKTIARARERALELRLEEIGAAGEIQSSAQVHPSLPSSPMSLPSLVVSTLRGPQAPSPGASQAVPSSVLSDPPAKPQPARDNGKALEKVPESPDSKSSPAARQNGSAEVPATQEVPKSRRKNPQPPRHPWPRGNFTPEQERTRAQIGWQAFADALYDAAVQPQPPSPAR